MVFHQFADCPHTTIAQVIDVVHRAVAVLELHQIAHHFEDILFTQRALLQWDVELEPMVELQPAYLGEIVAIRIEKQVVEKIGRRLHRRWIAGP